MTVDTLIVEAATSPEDDARKISLDGALAAHHLFRWL
jgi:hypothetical protein